MTRVTIVLDDNLQKRMRLMQADIIKKTNENCSFSNVVNLVLEKGLEVLDS